MYILCLDAVIISVKLIQQFSYINVRRKQNIVDSLPPGLLEGRPAGGSLLLTHHQVS